MHVQKFFVIDFTASSKFCRLSRFINSSCYSNVLGSQEIGSMGIGAGFCMYDVIFIYKAIENSAISSTAANRIVVRLYT